MHSVDLVDDTFIAAQPQALADVVADPKRWRRWWPARQLEVFMDRGVKGQRWSIAGDLVGSSEVWIEAYRDGAILHYYVRADPGGADRGERLSSRRADRIRRAEAQQWKRNVWQLKREMEAGRAPGSPAA